MRKIVLSLFCLATLTCCSNYSYGGFSKLSVTDKAKLVKCDRIRDLMRVWGVVGASSAAAAGTGGITALNYTNRDEQKMIAWGGVTLGIFSAISTYLFGTYSGEYSLYNCDGMAETFKKKTNDP